MTVFLVCFAGGLGALARATVDWVVTRRAPAWLATLLVNTTGSFALGWASQVLDGDVLTVVGAGFLGGFTTFSSACWQVAREIGRRSWPLAVGYGVATVALCLGAVWLGLRLG
ncbi:CrcB family protein [Tessaracoccus sp. OS52]|uniref:fluoride efflux transporter FluC n=1 Tax=Tessaracoccus sp. OS52 TaxID=2886691 RepID=UPI001D10946B|nr:CrcB family protein [Tessaracoccus sp. OS52]